MKSGNQNGTVLITDKCQLKPSIYEDVHLAGFVVLSTLFLQ